MFSLKGYINKQTTCYLDFDKPDVIIQNGDHVPKIFECDYESDEEILISESDNESCLLDLSEDDSELQNEDVLPCREFCEVNTENLSPPPPKFPFDNTPGVNLPFDNNEILNLITTDTNRYADQCSNTFLQRFSCLKEWKPTDNAEVMMFLARQILQGIINKSIIEW
ncbi:Transposase IS4 [Popillia japonica]|uniref:Transposase IS4 n=1 Tax=Popillia japonica TaxID=7064 RepID=A0AAW1N0I9_POPJA